MVLNNFLHPELPDPRIPTIPSIAAEILRLVRDGEDDLEPLTVLAGRDPALSLKMLRAANSRHFKGELCTSVHEATRRLGLNAVKGISLGFSLADCVAPAEDNDWEVGFDYVEYWRRSIRCATFATELAMASCACPPEMARLAALVQDVGMIALHRMYGDLYLQAIDISKSHAGLAAIEQRSFGTDHQQVAGALLRRWNAPAVLVEAVRFHHCAESSAEDALPLARCIELAGRIEASDAGAISSRLGRLAKQWLNLDLADFSALVERVRREDAPVDSGFDSERMLAEAEVARIEHELTILRLTEQGCDAVDEQCEDVIRLYGSDARSRTAA